MFRFIDRSASLAKLLAWFSEFMAKRRGLPVVVGIGLVIVSFALQIISLYADSTSLQLAGIIIQHTGILVGFIGLLLSEPLGR
jgi:hypothetical protein